MPLSGELRAPLHLKFTPYNQPTINTIRNMAAKSQAGLLAHEMTYIPQITLLAGASVEFR
jgi:hypothetical protein